MKLTTTIIVDDEPEARQGVGVVLNRKSKS